MRQLQPVIWAKGTFLTPQHLQAQERFIESTLEFRLEALNFRPWGFHELLFNEEALAEGKLAISRAAGISSPRFTTRLTTRIASNSSAI